MSDLLIKGARIVDAGREMAGDVLIAGGIIKEVAEEIPPPKGIPLLPAGGKFLLPAFVDLHAHFRDPGFPQKEDLLSGSRAAAHGGFTVVSLMPNTDPPCDSPEVARYVLDKARRIGLVEVHLVGAITRGLRGEELVDMEVLAPYVWAFSDDGHGVEDHRLMWEAAKRARELRKTIYPHPEFRGLPSRELGEELMVARDLWICRRTGARFHMAHISSPGAVELVALAKEKGLSVTCEATPHHLCLSREEADHPVNPPISTREAVDALVKGLVEGIIDAVATDHAPHTDADVAAGVPGISGIETAFPLLYTRLVKTGTIGLRTLSRLLSLGPARIMGLRKRGLVREGFVGDLVLVTEEELEVTGDFFLSKGKNTPLLGWRLRGRVWATIREGEVIYLDGKVKGRDFDDHRQVIRGG